MGGNVPIPITTRKPVRNRPRSSTAAPELSTKSSGLAHRLQIQLGRGATTYVATTRSGKYDWYRAHERMTSRNPTASTKEREMMVLRPAVGMAESRSPRVGGGINRRI